MVFVGHSPTNVAEPDAVVVSAAIPAGNPEVREAQKRGIPVLTRAQVLAALMQGKRTVAVAGTHGKTTTTSMVTVMCARLGLEPSFVIGGDVNEIGSGAGHGSGDVFVAEADESDGSFLLYHPELGVITNIEQDHVDFYRSRQDVEAAFAAFAGQSRSVIACWDDPGVRQALSGSMGNVLRYGVGADADMVVSEEELRWNGSTATMRFEGEEISVLLSVPGRHNLLNAAATLGVAARLGLPLAAAAEALRSFGGVRRRFECRRGVQALAGRDRDGAALLWGRRRRD